MVVEAADEEEKEVHEVEKITDHDGSVKAGTRRYKVRWAGWTEEHDSWLYLKDLEHCSELVQEYELAQVGVFTVAHLEEIAGQEGMLVASVTPGTVGTGARDEGDKAITLKMDLNGEETPEELLEKICREAGISKEDIVLAWASPPCETFSRANWSNLSRGNNHRKKEEGWPPAEGEKGLKAEQHDRLIPRVMAVLELVQRHVMENPAGGLEKMYYMLDWEDQKKVIDLCAFAWPFKKTTNLWIKGFEWEPKGVTGDGRCRDKCGMGAVDVLTRRFRHYMALAVDPQRGPRGANAAKMTCGMPEMLVAELLEGINEVEKIEGKVVLDLCAGFQSLRETVLAMGGKYVAVDVAGQRPVKAVEPCKGA